MSNIINLIPIEHENQRVLTTQQIADGYETEHTVIRNNFHRNKDRYILGIHYYLLEGADLQSFKATSQIEILPNVNSMYLWTKKGALLHAKSLNTDKAWEVYGELVDTYFKAQEMSVQIKSLPPELQLFKQIFDSQAKIYLEQKRLESMTLETKTGIEQANEKINTIRDTFATLPKDQWRKWVNASFVEMNKAADIPYDTLKNESYELLKARINTNLPQRVRNAQQRLIEAGATKTVINKYNRLDAIEEDKKLKEIYTGIIKELRLKYLV